MSGDTPATDPAPQPPVPFEGLEILGDIDVGLCVDGVCEVPGGLADAPRSSDEADAAT